MKAVLISIQPYWVFLIIAKTMGWEIDREKTVEVRKDFPKYLDWNKKAIIYCSKNKQSFNQIPKKYQPLMKKFLGKAIGEFVCDRIDEIGYSPEMHGQYVSNIENLHKVSCVNFEEMFDYIADGFGYGWHISNLAIYDKPKELSEFCKPCNDSHDPMYGSYCNSCDIRNSLTRPPQSWCYVEELRA